MAGPGWIGALQIADGIVQRRQRPRPGRHLAGRRQGDDPLAYQRLPRPERRPAVQGDPQIHESAPEGIPQRCLRPGQARSSRPSPPSRSRPAGSASSCTWATAKACSTRLPPPIGRRSPARWSPSGSPASPCRSAAASCRQCCTGFPTSTGGVVLRTAVEEEKLTDALKRFDAAFAGAILYSTEAAIAGRGRRHRGLSRPSCRRCVRTTPHAAGRQDEAGRRLPLHRHRHPRRPRRRYRRSPSTRRSSRPTWTISSSPRWSSNGGRRRIGPADAAGRPRPDAWPTKTPGSSTRTCCSARKSPSRRISSTRRPGFTKTSPTRAGRCRGGGGHQGHRQAASAAR